MKIEDTKTQASSKTVYTVDSLKDRVVLLTGGTGSFGTKFVELALKHNPKAIRVFSRGEFLQWEMERRFNDERLRFFIGDVRDRNRVYRAMKDVDIVVHAAALKQVPACEYNPIEAVMTNVMGAVNIVDSAIDSGVENVIAISSDKACHPINLYGSTKLVAEKLFIQANSYTGGKGTRFSVVRYGNVVGSRGSVIPLFKRQKEEGRLSITDLRMTRFWLTLDQGVEFVIKCLSRMVGGEIFIPKIPSMKLTDLAEVIAPGIPCETTGIRPGEKLHEILLTEEESRHTRELEDHFVVEPEFPFWATKELWWGSLLGGKQVPEGFVYSSDRNERVLSEEELRKMVKGLE